MKIDLEMTLNRSDWGHSVVLAREIELNTVPRIGEEIAFAYGHVLEVEKVCHLEHTGRPYLTLESAEADEDEWDETMVQLGEHGWEVV